jgi:hypothetical protein
MMKGNSMKKVLCISLSLFSVFINISVFAAAAEETDYLAILVDGHKIGYAVHTRKADASKVTTTDELNMLIARGPTAMRYVSKEVSIESLTGKPLRFEFSQNISGIKQTRKGDIRDGKVKMLVQNGPATETLNIPYPAGSLMAEGLRLLQIKQGLQPGLKYEALIFRPDMDEAIRAQVQVGPKTKIDLLGRILELSEVKMSMQFGEQVISQTSYVDDEFNALKTISPMMGMTLELIACEKEFALRQDDIVDFLDKLSIACPMALTKAQLAEPITYELTATTDKPLIIPTTDTQTVKEIAPGKIEVTVQSLAPQGTAKYPYDGKDKDIKKALESTEYLQTKDDKIVDLVKHAATTPDDAVKAALQIENFVMGYITKKDFSVGYASAAEVARSRQGDCTEHALLTAAICRAAGIPARVACGLVYADAIGDKKNVFGAHMWTEVYLGDKWYPIDATRAPNGFSAGHITLARSDGNPTDFFSLVNTLGCFKIDKVTVAANADKAPTAAK